ncbi:nucleotidyltransferase family protein [Desulfitibacter alkalitolerans]|uniref:nucleotidyltransferase family protein n=1 Tax=Desulfitibacter alkalitolerans TaxID=264641 RepID=UPI000487CCFA|nr:nucleotidyltransferase domain-containing protein [Desulfitibacter alkalitolerans]
MSLTEIRDVVSKIAKKYPILSIDLFGSYASGEASKDSDIDLIVYFDENVASLFDMSGLKLDIQDELNKKVDIVAGPIKEDSYLTIGKKVKIYEA